MRIRVGSPITRNRAAIISARSTGIGLGSGIGSPAGLDFFTVHLLYNCEVVIAPRYSLARFGSTSPP
jgi:hypothetical protein